ncbi:hypothetical protein HDU97_005319 [Phlyctochytrium planicorne]|nr:hypothetical protein HDU97_005319 [Phlyctochytrium planicorne]
MFALSIVPVVIGNAIVLLIVYLMRTTPSLGNIYINPAAAAVIGVSATYEVHGIVAFAYAVKGWKGVCIHASVATLIVLLFEFAVMMVTSIYVNPASRLLELLAFLISVYYSNLIYNICICDRKDPLEAINHRNSMENLPTLPLSRLARITNKFSDDKLARDFRIHSFFVGQNFSKTLLFLKAQSLSEVVFWGFCIGQILIERIVPRSASIVKFIRDLSGRRRRVLSELQEPDVEDCASVRVPKAVADELPASPAKDLDTITSEESPATDQPFMTVLSPHATIMTHRVVEALSALENVYALERNDYVYVNYNSTMNAICFAFIFLDVATAKSNTAAHFWRFAVYLGLEWILESIAMAIEFAKNDPLEAMNSSSKEHLEVLSFAQVAQKAVFQAATGLLFLCFTALMQIAGNLYVQAFIDIMLIGVQYLFFIGTNKFSEEHTARNFRIYSLFFGQYISKALLFQRSATLSEGVFWGFCVGQVLLERIIPRGPKIVRQLRLLYTRRRHVAPESHEMNDELSIPVEPSPANDLPLPPTDENDGRKLVDTNGATRNFTTTRETLAVDSDVVTRQVEKALTVIKSVYTLERNDYVFVNYLTSLSSVGYYMASHFISQASRDYHEQFWKFFVYIGLEMFLECIAMETELWLNDVAIGSFLPLNFQSILGQSFVIAEYGMCFTAALHNIFGYG